MINSQRPSGVNRVPKYCRQKSAGRVDRAYVKIDGRKISLGIFNSPDSRAKYAEILSGFAKGVPHGQNSKPLENNAKNDLSPGQGATISELTVAFLDFAKGYYPTGGEYGDHVRAVRPLCKLHGTTLAKDFGPRALKAVRQSLVDRGLARNTINKQTRRIVNLFRWATEEEILPATVHHALQAVRPLRRGRSSAREPQQVRPVDAATVEATLAELPTVLQNMIRLQLLLGCRPGELLGMRPCDIVRTGEVWVYTPSSHKTEHFGHSRTIAIGPRGQDILLRYLARASDAVCFETRASDPRRPVGVPYTTDSYRRALQRAAKRAGVASWFPHQLRHTAATDVRARFGLEAAQVVLGHHNASITQVYAERDATLAEKVAMAVG